MVTSAQGRYNQQQLARQMRGRRRSLAGMKGTGMGKPVEHINYGTGPSLPSTAQPWANVAPASGGYYGTDGGGGQGAFFVPKFGGPVPSFALDPSLAGGSVSIDDFGSKTFPNLIPFYNEAMRYDLGSRTNMRQAWEAGLQNEQAKATEARNRMVAEAQYGQGGLAWEQSQLARDRLGQEASESAFGREHETEMQAGSLASRETIAGMPYEWKKLLMESPLIQKIFGFGGGGEYEQPRSISPLAGPAEEEFNRRELASSGRRAADEAQYLQGDLESSTGPGGGGMGGGPGGTVAANRAAMMRLQTRAGERESLRQQMIERAMAERGQNIGLIGNMFA